jgi:hypothetical protein
MKYNVYLIPGNARHQDTVLKRTVVEASVREVQEAHRAAIAEAHVGAGSVAHPARDEDGAAGAHGGVAQRQRLPLRELRQHAADLAATQPPASGCGCALRWMVSSSPAASDVAVWWEPSRRQTQPLATVASSSATHNIHAWVL